MLTDAILITIYATLALLVVATMVSSAVHGIHQKLAKVYLGISVCLLSWLFLTFAYHIVTNPKLAEYLDNLTFVFIAFMPVILLMFVLQFYSDKQILSTKVIILLSIIPTITALISVIPPLNWLLRTNYTIFQFSPLHIADYDWNTWFYVHLIYSYLLLGLSGSLIIRQFRKQPTEYKFPSALLIVSILIIYLSDLPILNIPTTIVDNTLMGVCIAMVIMYFAIANNPTVEFLSSARKTLYNNLDIPIFILDKQDYVLDMNQEAHRLLKQLGHVNDLPPFSFQNITQAISEVGGVFKCGYIGDDVAHIIVGINGDNIVMRQVRREFFDNKGRFWGSYVALMDITKLSQMIDELQYKAEVDPLTGIPNRLAYEQKLLELDIPENLPISFVIGDVNRLKQVNDTLGHKYRDLLLKSVAQILTEFCPEGGFSARIGGDEFIMILPGCSTEVAQGIVEDIHNKLKKDKAQFLGASIALGHISKTKPGQDTCVLISQADHLMYSQKKYNRRNPV